MNGTEPELHTLTGAYALHALPEGERELFEGHLAVCEACAQEVAELTATAERLGLAVAESPPAEMKERVLTRIAAVRQEPPPAGEGRVGRGGAGGRGGRSGRAGRGGGGLGGVGGGRVRGRTLRALPRLTLAACLVAAALGGVAVWQYESAQQARHAQQQAEGRSSELARVLSAPDAKTVTSKALPGGGRGRAVVSHDRDRAAFVSSGMSTPPSGKVYQLWYKDRDGMRSAGLMEAASDTAHAVLLEGRLGDASGMGITVEPAGGSRQPTSKPVALMKLPA